VSVNLERFQKLAKLDKETVSVINDNIQNITYVEIKEKLNRLSEELWIGGQLESFAAVQAIIKKYEYSISHIESIKERGQWI
jgi:hypothetical protein